MASRAHRITVAALASAAVLFVITTTTLPPLRALLRAPETPFDRSLAHHVAPAFALIAEARRVVPEGSSVTVTSEPVDPSLDTMTHRLGVALLPVCSVYPAALDGQPRPDFSSQAEYIIVVGAVPAAPPGDLLFKGPKGTVWRRRAR